MSHNCSATVLTCIDFRFWKRLLAYLEEKKLDSFDLLSMAGGAKNVLDDRTREIVYSQLDICVQKHCIGKVYLVNHIDCGAYGGSSAFKDITEEVGKLTGDLKLAKKLLLEKYPKLQVEMLLMYFDRIDIIE